MKGLHLFILCSAFVLCPAPAGLHAQSALDTARTLAAHGDLPGATVVISRALNDNPTDLALLMQRAAWYEAQQRDSLALYDYTAVTTWYPRNAEAHAHLAHVFARLEDNWMANSAWIIAVELDPANTSYRLAHARQLLNGMKTREWMVRGYRYITILMAETERVLAGDAASIPALAIRVDAMLLKQDYANAIGPARALVDAAPDSAQYHFNLGFALVFSGGIRESLPHISKALSLLPDTRAKDSTRVNWLCYRSFVRHATGDSAGAAIDLGEAHRCAGHSPEGISFVAMTANAEDENALAHELYLQAWQTDTSRVSDLLKAANISHATGRHEDAVREFGLLLESRPAWEEALIDCARMHIDSSEHDAAEPLLRRAIEVNSGNVTIYPLMATVALKRGNIGEALHHLTMAHVYDSTYAEAWVYHAWVLEVQGFNTQALEMLTKAIEQNPDYGWAWYRRARLRARMEDVTQACEDAQRAMDLNVEEAAEFIADYCTEE